MPHAQITAQAIAVENAGTAVVTHAAETAKAQAMPLAAEDAALARISAMDAQADAKETVAEVALQHPQDDFLYGWEVQS